MKKKLSYNSPVILSFVVLSGIALALNTITNGKANLTLFSTYHSSLIDPLTYLRFITHIFGHSSWEHYASNMIYILLLGPLLEEKYKSVRIVEIVVVTALATGLINYILFPDIVLCGASGVCFAFILLSSLTSFRKGEIPITFLLVAVIFIGQQVVNGLLVVDNVSNMAHIVGGIVGAVFGFAILKNKC